MIPPVRTEHQTFGEFYADLIESGMSVDREVERSPAFLLYTAKWLSGTGGWFDAEQCGWFILLLCEAWQSGDPQGTLPNDEQMLKSLGKYNPEQVLRVIRLSSSGPWPDTDWARLVKGLNFEGRWEKVRSKFKPVPGFEETLVHNPQLTRVLMESIHYKRRLSLAGRKGGASTANHWKELSSTNKGVRVNRSSSTGPGQVMDRAMIRPGLISTSTSTNLREKPKNAVREHGLNSDIQIDVETDVLEDLEGVLGNGEKSTILIPSHSKFPINLTWNLSQKWQQWLSENFIELTPPRLNEIRIEFINYWSSPQQAGAEKTQRNWDITFKNRIIQLRDRGILYKSRGVSSNGQRSTVEIAEEQLAKIRIERASLEAAAKNEFPLLSPDEDD